MRIALVAGEKSGDILGAGLIRALKQRFPEATFEGIAGPEMLEQGCETFFDMEELSVMGLVEVLSRLPRLLSIRKSLIARWRQSPPDIFIGIDAPDFNLTLEKKLKQSSIKTVHYVSPSIWAWRQKRVFKVKKATDLVLALLPFEKAFYDRFSVPCEYVGHTLAEQIPMESSQKQAREKLGLDNSQMILALLPGSRSNEIELLSEDFLKAAQLFKSAHPDLVTVSPYVSQKRLAHFKQIKDRIAPDLDIHFFDYQSRDVMAASDLILMASGTATLEAALIKRPVVVAYKFKPLSYLIFKRLVKVKYFSLPNLLADRMIIPEMLQDQVTPTTLFEQLQNLHSQPFEPLHQAFVEIHTKLKQDADQKAATAVAKLIESS